MKKASADGVHVSTGPHHAHHAHSRTFTRNQLVVCAPHPPALSSFVRRIAAWVLFLLLLFVILLGVGLFEERLQRIQLACGVAFRVVVAFFHGIHGDVADKVILVLLCFIINIIKARNGDVIIKCTRQHTYWKWQSASLRKLRESTAESAPAALHGMQGERGRRWQPIHMNTNVLRVELKGFVLCITKHLCVCVNACVCMRAGRREAGGRAIVQNVRRIYLLVVELSPIVNPQQFFRFHWSNIVRFWTRRPFLFGFSFVDTKLARHKRL